VTPSRGSDARVKIKVTVMTRKGRVVSFFSVKIEADTDSCCPRWHQP